MYHWTFKLTFSMMVLLWTILSIFMSSVSGKDLNYTIKEEQKANHYIGNIREDYNLKAYLTSDEDYENLKYSILSQGNIYAKYFTVNERTSTLFTQENIDREKLEHCEFSLTCDLPVDIIAKATVGTFFRKIRVKIFIEDINDNKPTFSTNVTTLEFSEESVRGFYKTIIGADDQDSGINSVQKYDIQESDVPFTVDFEKLVDGSSSVKVIVDKSLDSETKNFYQLHILAVDGGETSYTGTITVNITITDENDNPPIFSQTTYNITVKETSPVGTEILRVTATDKDSGINGKVFYRLSPHQKDVLHSMFAVNETTGSLSLLKPLVYEPGEVHHVIVEASDSATKPLFTQASVYITVLDSGNDAPEININLLSNDHVAKISENAKTGAAVAHIGVTDDDIGDNGKVTCRVIQNYFFILQPLGIDEYKVVVHQPLNRETIEQHDVTVLCQDLGSPPLNSTASFVVKILDENDHSPRFIKQRYDSVITENNKIGASVLTVSANDFDIGINSEVKYSLNETDKYNFTVDADLGIIYANFVLDREVVKNFTFKVVAKDRGKPQLTGTSVVKLTVQDENDNRPNFSKTIYTFNVIENENSSTFVGEVMATDPDDGENGKVEFMLSPEVTNDLPFMILPNGSIYTTRLLDRELVPHGYNFNVRAIDKGKIPLHNVAHVTIFVDDVNDNSPVISYPAYDNKTVKITFDLSPDLPFAKVSAKDADLDFNAKLIYSIEDKSMKNIFHMDPTTGDIYLARPLTQGDIKTYTFTIVVEDQGTPRKFTKQNLTVIVTTPDITTPPGEGTEGYLVIVIVIICVTVVLSVTIILIICILRKVDIKGKNKKHVNKENGTVNGREMYDAIARNAEIEKRERAEKKVSFSIDSHPAVCLSANSQNNISKKDLAVEEILDRIMPPETPNKISQLKKSNNYHQQTTSQDPTMPTAARLQRHQEYLQQQEKHWAGHSLEVPFKRQDDNHSETSGETTTSDSGRGGSESDIQSSGGLSHCLELGKQDYLKNMYSPTNSPGKHKSSQEPDIHRDHVHHQKQPHNHQPIHYKHVYNRRHSDSRTANGSQSPSSHISNNNAVQYLKSGVSPRDYRSRNGVHWKGITDVLNNSMATIEDYDEDDNTTTSGSYTVEEQDINSEMFFGTDCIV